MKKILAILLSAALLFGCVSVCAFADEAEEEAVKAVCSGVGDVNYDGFVKADDARLVLRYAVKLETEETLAKYGPAAAQRCETDNDASKIGASDARTVLRIAVRLQEQPGHNTETVVQDAKWTAPGAEKLVCKACGETVSETAVPSKIDAMIKDANDWAAEKGLEGFIKGVSEDNGAKLELELNADAIWDGITLADGAFDGFLTEAGAYVKEHLADAVIKLDDAELYNGKLANTAVKNAIFGVFGGFFYKLANAENGVYGEYAFNIDGEDVALTVKMTGTDEHVAKVQAFAGVIADHVSAEVNDGDLTITVQMPEALMDTVKAHGGLDAVNSATLGECLAYLQAASIDTIVGSQQGAVKKLCETVCSASSFVNKVLGKVTAAKVNGVDLLAEKAAFTPAENSVKGLIAAVSGMLSENVKNTSMGRFYNENMNAYVLSAEVTVDVTNADLFENGAITETVNFVFIP